MTGIGAVAIGRNEGQRLRLCLESLIPHARRIVYVDSGSTDQSVAMACELGVEVVELDTDAPFSAARARNAGLRRLLELDPQLELVMFVDGDCEVRPDWWEQAGTALRDRPRLAVVCGRRRERDPDASIYNRLCDIEWDTPPGPASACGGDALMRIEALRQVNGYRDEVIAGEEPELCLRLCRLGWQVARLDAEMTLHDARMMRFGQWWQRNVRAGHAYAEGRFLHGASPERYRVRETRSNWLWGAVLPAGMITAAIAGFVWPWAWLGLIGVLAYPVLAMRVYRHYRRRRRAGDAALAAVFIVLGKLPQAIGQIRYWRRRRAGGPRTVIEYKGPEQVRSNSVSS